MSEAELLSVAGVSVTFATDAGAAPAAIEVSYSIAAGEVLAVVGESGSGKTVTAMSLLRLLPPTATVTGAAFLNGTNLFELDHERLREIRGGRVGFVFQEPMTALNPVFTIGAQLAEAITAHRRVSSGQARARAGELLELVGLPDPARVLRSYPHELSGGQLQRVVIAMAVANEPELLIADEPTTALDVTVQAGILELLRDLRSRLGAGILLITHDMGVVADLADRVAVMRAGRVVEQGSVTELFAHPRHDYTRQLLDSVISLPGTVAPPPAEDDPATLIERGDQIAVVGHPATRSVRDDPTAEAALRITDLSVVYGGRLRSFSLRAVDRVSVHIEPGEVLGLVGESGSGKTTLASAIVGLATPTSGLIELDGADLPTLRGRSRRAALRRIGVVFQDPGSSLNPRASIGASIAQPLRLHSELRGARLNQRVRELLDSVALPADLNNRFPHELSGGQRQRVAIARAIALRPALLIADEPTSALDVSVQARVLELLRSLQTELRFACLFISHDLAVIEQVAGRVAVMHRGHIVEQGPADAVLTAPLHPYTHLLVTSAPVADPADQRRRRVAWRAAELSVRAGSAPRQPGDQ
ncbi:MAG TPA: ABC transporter ATP-binding protein [Pseudonocardiaceae bacterium]|nr:ABC transporter ATP-binding protein [Pseudonocardiaceae bacterium]